jgi:GT2 family glycosyltransferase
MLFDQERKPEVGLCGYKPTIRHLFNHYFFISKVFPGREWSRGFFSREMQKEPLKLDWVSGACLLLRRSAVDDVGLLNERFFLYLEDMDLCLRLKKKGYASYLLNSSHVIYVSKVLRRLQISF